MGKVELVQHGPTGTILARVDFQLKYGKRDDALLAEFKASFPGATFNWSKFHWIVTLNCQETAETLLRFAHGRGWTTDFEQLEHLVTQLPRRQSEYVATYEDSVVRLRYPYNLDLNGELSFVQGARFNRDERAWDVVLTVDACTKLMPLFAKYQFTYSPEVTQAIAQAYGIEQQAIKDSSAIDAVLPEELTARLGVELYPFQRAGAKFAMERKRVIIADQPGLGKTLEAIAAVEGLNAYRVLCIVPNSMRLTWIAEWRRACPHRKVVTMYGKRKAPLPVTVNGKVENIQVNTHAGDVIIINYDQVKRFKNNLKRMHFQAVILDESHYIKSDKTLRTQAVLEVVQDIEYRFLLTGTPVLNAPWELPTQLQAAGRIADFGGITRFKRDWLQGRLVTMLDRRTGKERKYMEYGTPDTDDNYYEHLNQLNERLRPFMIRRYKKDVFTELPDKTRAVVQTEISNERDYRLAEQDLIAWVKQMVADTFELDIMQLLALDVDEQRHLLEIHQSEAATRALKNYALRRIQALRQLAVEGKLEESIAWIKSFLESGEKLVIYAIHRKVQAALYAAFPDAAVLRGDDSILVRKQNELRFQNDPNCKLIIASVSAAAEGITLTAASDLAILEMPWTPGKCTQVEDRIHRIGQTRGSTIHYLLAGNTIDQWLAAKVEAKRKIVDSVTEGADAERVFEGSILDEMMVQLLGMAGK
jgi:SWI/SNF-related matrix-associated actin-dependent regulator 1 of chromatin subfamily A